MFLRLIRLRIPRARPVGVLQVIALGLFFLLQACSQRPAIEITNPWVRETIAGRDNTAGYFVLRNNSQVSITLTGARSPYARAIEMHKTVQHDGRVRMQRVPEYAIAPGEQIAFAPGGLHLMLFGVTGAPESLPITLLFAEGKQETVSFSKLSN